MTHFWISDERHQPEQYGCPGFAKLPLSELPYYPKIPAINQRVVQLS